MKQINTIGKILNSILCDFTMYDTTSEELYLFISVQMLIARSKKMYISKYWSTNPLLYSPIFGKIMSRNRFQIFLCYIHFCNNENQVTDDHLFKIDMVLQDIKKFQICYGAISKSCHR